MKRLAAACAVLMLAISTTGAADDVDTLLGKALDEIAKNGSQDTSAAEHYLEAILEQQPNHLEAQWLLLVIRLAPPKNTPFCDTATALAAFSSAFAPVAKLARESKQETFLHYMNAKHAGFYKDFDTAIVEIDRAVTLDPRAPRYLKAKGELLIDSGRWKRSDADIDAGIGVLTQARDLFRKYPGPFGSDTSYEFSVATAIMSLSRPRWEDVIEHYKRYLETGPKDSVLYAYALNNLSLAYRRAGDCSRAKESAEKALAVMKFGAAQTNKRYAEFCLEMQKTGLVAAR